MLLQGPDPVCGQGQLPDMVAPVALEIDEGQAAVGGDDLVLPAAGLGEDHPLDCDGLVGQVPRRAEAAAVRVQGLQHRHDKARGGAKAGAGGQVRHHVHLQAGLKSQFLQGRADGGMLDLIDLVHRLAAPVGETDAVVEIFLQERLRRHVGVAVDRGREHGAPMLVEMIGKIAAAAEEAHPHRRAGDHHRVPALYGGGSRGGSRRGRAAGREAALPAPRQKGRTRHRLLASTRAEPGFT